MAVELNPHLMKIGIKIGKYARLGDKHCFHPLLTSRLKNPAGTCTESMNLGQGYMSVQGARKPPPGLCLEIKRWPIP